LRGADHQTGLRIQTNDACFDKLKPLFEGEKHIDSSRWVKDRNPCMMLVTQALSGTTCNAQPCADSLIQGVVCTPAGVSPVPFMHPPDRHARSPCLPGLCRQALLAKLAGKEGWASDSAFKPCSPMKLSCGKGDYYGTLQGKVPYIAVRR
jgi:hypothetical protein